MQGRHPTQASESSVGDRARHRMLAATSVLVATFSLAVCGHASAVTVPVGQCQLTMRVIVHRLSTHNGGLSAFRSSSGAASCTGRLGPWLMGGGTGWSSSSGTLRMDTAREAVATGRCGVARVDGAFWAEVPRFAWFNPAMVTIGGSFRLSPRGSALAIAGSGHLIQTHKSPIAYASPLAGTATLDAANNQSCSARSWMGRLTLRVGLH